MRKQALHMIGALAITSAAYAGDSYSAKSSKEVIAPPPAPACGWNWFAGASAGQLLDAEEQMYNIHFGTERSCLGDPATHAFFVELGYANIDEGFQAYGTANVPVNVDAEIIPLTLNYKYERALSGAFSWYAGAGAGIAFVDADYETYGDPIGSYDDTVFYAQVFLGVVYNFSPATEVYAGARYIFMDDPSLSGISELDDQASLDGDVLVEVGLRYNF